MLLFGKRFRVEFFDHSIGYNSLCYVDNTISITSELHDALYRDYLATMYFQK